MENLKTSKLVETNEQLTQKKYPTQQEKSKLNLIKSNVAHQEIPNCSLCILLHNSYVLCLFKFIFKKGF